MLLLVGDVFLAAAAISYMGAFTGTYRQEMASSWVSRCRELAIPVSPCFSLQVSDPLLEVVLLYAGAAGWVDTWLVGGVRVCCRGG